MDKKSQIRNIIVLSAVVAAAILLLGAASLMKEQPASGGSEVLITLDGKEYAREKLGTPRDITIDQGDGKINVIHIDEDGAVMASSTCDNQLCVHMGEVTVENWEYRLNQTFIVCLPNKVTVELVVADQGAE